MYLNLSETFSVKLEETAESSGIPDLFHSSPLLVDDLVALAIDIE
jgi:hypothetical protein